MPATDSPLEEERLAAEVQGDSEDMGAVMAGEVMPRIFTLVGQDTAISSSNFSVLVVAGDLAVVGEVSISRRRRNAGVMSRLIFS